MNEIVITVKRKADGWRVEAHDGSGERWWLQRGYRDEFAADAAVAQVLGEFWRLLRSAEEE